MNITENPDKSLVACKKIKISKHTCPDLSRFVQLIENLVQNMYSILTLDNVSDNWVIVLLKDKYLKTLIHATNTLKADKIVKVLEALAKSKKILLE